MRAQLIITTLAITLFIVIAYRYAVYSEWRIPSELARSLLKSGKIDLLLDVRTDLERKTLGIVPNSVHIQAADLNAEMPRRYPNKDIVILIYCNTGHRARLAADKLHAMDYRNTYYISASHTTLL